MQRSNSTISKFPLLRLLSTQQQQFKAAEPCQQCKIRNIGVIAHIDAGKTTTTERILYYCGRTRRLGDVDRGDTVTDYLPEERSRGITIKAAAISVGWRGHQINLIDTPGHVDFTVEVERSLRVLDGAVVVLDGSNGVEAQTRTVWRQANRHQIPKIVFVNKLDKLGADYHDCVRDVEKRLDCRPIVLNQPIYENEQPVAIHDVLNDRILRYSGVNNEEIMSSPANRTEMQGKLFERVAELDVQFLEDFLDDAKNVSIEKAMAAIARLTASSQIVPVLSGAALRNIGVQSILDAVIDYLPPPKVSNESTTKALAFKVVVDEQRGLLVFVRVYSGSIRPGQALFRIGRDASIIKERLQKVFHVSASNYQEVDQVGPGCIAALSGLKWTATGDTLTDKNDLGNVLPTVSIPSPVFQMACSVEAGRKSEGDRLEEALKTMALEDPSLNVQQDPNTGQLVLGGQGELHLEIAGKRLIKQFGVESLTWSPPRIAFREAINMDSGSFSGDLQYERIVSENVRLTALLSMTIEPLPLVEDTYVSDAVKIDCPASVLRIPKHLDLGEYMNAVKEGIQTGLVNGPLWGNRVIGVGCWITKAWWIDASSTPIAFRHAAIQLVSNIAKANQGHYRRAEPVMSVRMDIDSSHPGAILPDFFSVRRGSVHEHGPDPADPTRRYVIMGEAPLAQLVGYVTWLRTASSGRASLEMSLRGYRILE